MGIIYDSQFNRPSIPTLTEVCNASKDPITNIVSAGNQVIGDILELDMHNWQNTKRVVIGIGDTGAFNITKTGWADKLGEIYDSYYNKPPFISTATTNLNMDSNDITYLNEIDMVGAGNSTIALSIDPITKLIRYTTGQWLLDGNDNYGIIYDTKFNKPPFISTATSDLDMNFNSITNVQGMTTESVTFPSNQIYSNGVLLSVTRDSANTTGGIYDSRYNPPENDGYFKKNSAGALDMNLNNIIGVGQIGITGNTIQVEPGTNLLCYTKSEFVTGYGVIYDSLYNNPFNYTKGVTGSGQPIIINANLNPGRSLLKAQFVMSSENNDIFLCIDQLFSYSWNDPTFSTIAGTPTILGSQGITGLIVLSQIGVSLVITINISGYNVPTTITWALTYTSTCTLSSR